MSDKDLKTIVCRLFFDGSITPVSDIQQLLATTFDVHVQCESYDKFENWQELSFDIPFEKHPHEALNQTLKKLGGNWHITRGEGPGDYSGSAVWNPEMGGELQFPDLKFGDVSVCFRKGIPERHLKIMLDYDCWPLWTQDGDNYPPHHLAVSSELKDRLIAWSDQYDALLNRENPIHSYHSPETDLALEEEGLSLWTALQSELGKSWSISYYSLVENKLYNS